MSTREQLPRSCLGPTACLRCGGKGLIPWTRLEGLLFCRQCGSWHRRDKSAGLVRVAPPESEIQVVMPTGLPSWRDASAEDGRRPLDEAWRAVAERLVEFLAPRCRAIVCWASGLAAAAALATTCWHWSAAAAIRAESAPLPAKLEQRVALLADAWLAKDVGRMLRLTDAARDRQLRRWLRCDPPPPRGPGSEAKFSKIEVVSVRPRSPTLAEVTLQLSMADKVDAAVKLPVKQMWLNRKGEWFFLPGVSSPPQ